MLGPGGLVGNLDGRVRIPAVAQQARRQIARGADVVLIVGLPGSERDRIELLPDGVRQVVEPFELHAVDDDRRPLVETDREVDRVLRVVQLDVGAHDARVGIAPVVIERLQPFEICFELRSIEVVLGRPRQPSALLRRQHGAKPRIVERRIA